MNSCACGHIQTSTVFEVYNNLIHAATCDNDMAKAQETFAAWQAWPFHSLLRSLSEA